MVVSAATGTERLLAPRAEVILEVVRMAVNEQYPSLIPTLYQGVVARRCFIVFSFTQAPFLLGGSGAYWRRTATRHRRQHCSARPEAGSIPRARLAALGGSRGLFIERRAYSYLRATVRAPLDHAGLPFEVFMSRRHSAHPANAPAFLLVIDMGICTR